MELKNNRGVTGVDVAIAVVVLTVFVAFVASLFYNTGNTAKKVERKSEATNLAIEVIEGMKVVGARNFSDLPPGEDTLTIDKINELNSSSITVPNGYTVKIEIDDKYNDNVVKILKVEVEYLSGKDTEKVDIQTLVKKEAFKEFNWYIYTPAQLKFLADFVNNGNELTTEQKEMLTQEGYDLNSVKITENTFIYLMNDLDLGARESNGNWETTANEALEWTPIGDSSEHTLKGTFEGNNHTISGVYVNADTNFNGIFGNSCSIQNLTIKNSYIKGGTCTAGIVGALRAGKIVNCHNINTTVILMGEASRILGGVGGQLSKGTEAQNCSNTGDVIGYGTNGSSGTQAGGVFGRASGTIENCENKGKVIGKGAHVGGVVAYLGTPGEIKNCKNIGVIEGDGDRVGGIVGSASRTTKINSCENKGAVTGNANFVGGIAGQATSGAEVSDCNNTGDITGKGERIGGIAGNIEDYATIKSCYNTGTVTGDCDGSLYVGGITGTMAQLNGQTNCEIEKCYNTGKVQAYKYVGGIIGNIAGQNSTLIKCYNKGSILGTEYIGAIAGYQSTTIGSTMNTLYYLNTVGIGAIQGVDDENNKVMSTTEDITTYEQFLTWIESK